MGLDLTKGVVFSGNSPNNSVTADKLNNLVDNGTIEPTFVSAKTAKLTADPGDYLLLWDSATLTFKKVSVQTLVPAFAAKSGFRGLAIVNTPAFPTTKLDVSATEIVMLQSGGTPRRVTSFSQTLDTSLYSAGSTANGRDFATPTAYTWYYVWAISDGTNDRTLFSSSATSPTLPSGYTYSTLLGAWQTTSSSTTLVYGVQYDREAAMNIGPQGNDSSVTTAMVPYILAGAQFSIAQINSVAGQWTAINMTRCIPPNICSAVHGTIGSVETSAANYIYGIATAAVTTETITGTSFDGTTFGVQLISAGTKASRSYGFAAAANFSCPVRVSQQIYAAVDVTTTKHSMRISGYTLNI